MARRIEIRFDINDEETVNSLARIRHALQQIGVLARNTASSLQEVGEGVSSAGEATQAVEEVADAAKDTTQRTDELSGAVKRAYHDFNKFGDVLNWFRWELLFTGGAITALVTRGIGEFAKLESAVTQAATNMANAISDNLLPQVERLAVAFGTPAEEVGRGLFLTVSSGISQQQAFPFLEQATRLARAGFAETATTVDVLTSTLNAYAMSAERAAEVSDKLFRAQVLGKTTIQELGSALGRVLPMAAQFGVSFEEALAAVTTLTRVGLSTEEAVTQVRSLLDALVQTSAAADRIAKQFQIPVGITAIRQFGLTGLLEIIRSRMREFPEFESQLKTFLGRMEAVNAIAALGASQWATYLDTLNQVRNATGDVDEALEHVTRTWEYQASQVREAASSVFRNLLIPALHDLRDNVLPGVSERLREMADVVAQIPPIIRELVVALTSLSGILLVIAGAGGMLAGAIRAIRGLMAPLGSILSAVAAAPGVVATALGGTAIVAGAGAVGGARRQREQMLSAIAEQQQAAALEESRRFADEATRTFFQGLAEQARRVVFQQPGRFIGASEEGMRRLRDELGENWVLFISRMVEAAGMVFQDETIQQQFQQEVERRLVGLQSQGMDAAEHYAEIQQEVFEEFVSPTGPVGRAVKDAAQRTLRERTFLEQLPEVFDLIDDQVGEVIREMIRRAEQMDDPQQMLNKVESSLTSLFTQLRSTFEDLDRVSKVTVVDATDELLSAVQSWANDLRETSEQFRLIEPFMRMLRRFTAEMQLRTIAESVREGARGVTIGPIQPGRRGIVTEPALAAAVAAVQPRLAEILRRFPEGMIDRAVQTFVNVFISLATQGEDLDSAAQQALQQLRSLLTELNLMGRLRGLVPTREAESLRATAGLLQGLAIPEDLRRRFQEAFGEEAPRQFVRVLNSVLGQEIQGSIGEMVRRAMEQAVTQAEAERQFQAMAEQLFPTEQIGASAEEIRAQFLSLADEMLRAGESVSSVARQFAELIAVLESGDLETAQRMLTELEDERRRRTEAEAEISTRAERMNTALVEEFESAFREQSPRIAEMIASGVLSPDAITRMQRFREGLSPQSLGRVSDELSNFIDELAQSSLESRAFQAAMELAREGLLDLDLATALLEGNYQRVIDAFDNLSSVLEEAEKRQRELSEAYQRAVGVLRRFGATMDNAGGYAIEAAGTFLIASQEGESTSSALLEASEAIADLSASLVEAIVPGEGGKTESTIKGAVSGAAQGAIIGGTIGGAPGAAAGAVIGGILGGISGYQAAVEASQEEIERWQERFMARFMGLADVIKDAIEEGLTGDDAQAAIKQFVDDMLWELVSAKIIESVFDRSGIIDALGEAAAEGDWERVQELINQSRDIADDLYLPLQEAYRAIYGEPESERPTGAAGIGSNVRVTTISGAFADKLDQLRVSIVSVLVEIRDILRGMSETTPGWSAGGRRTISVYGDVNINIEGVPEDEVAVLVDRQLGEMVG